MKKATLIFCAALFVAPAYAQVPLLDSLSFYGSLRTHLAAYEKKVELQNNASRIGFRLERNLPCDLVAFGGLELGVNLVRNNKLFNPNAASNPDESFFEDAEAAVFTRLGFIGIRSAKFGSLSFGKQWGVYYDVTAWTDDFWVFGGVASGTYNTGNDAGTEGTGRAENAIIYRYRRKKLAAGLQVQLNGREQNYAASLVATPSSKINVGVSFNTYSPSQEILNIVGNSKKRANSLAAGVKYIDGKFTGALVYDYNQSEVQYPPDSVVAFPANGVEGLVQYWVFPKLKCEGGFNYLKPVSTPAAIDPDFNLLRIIVGGAYYFLPEFLAYTEYNLDLGVNTEGNKPPNVFVLGLRYDFSFNKSKSKEQ
jgi:predicted porin